jgi:opacity protein-like surface antigen
MPGLGGAAISGHAGCSFPEENNLRAGLVSGFGFSFRVLGGLSILFDFSQWQNRSVESAGKLYNGTVTVSPLLAAVELEFFRNRFFFPYLFVGGAYVSARFRIGSYVSIPEVKIDQKIENGFALCFGLGARIAIAERLSFFSEASYLRRTAPAKTIYDDMNLGRSSREIIANLRFVQVQFGLKYYF